MLRSALTPGLRDAEKVRGIAVIENGGYMSWLSQRFAMCAPAGLEPTSLGNLPPTGTNPSGLPQTKNSSIPNPNLKDCSRFNLDTQVCTQLIETTTSRKTLWDLAGVDTYILSFPLPLKGAFWLVANTDKGEESLFFHVEEDIPIKLKPEYSQLQNLIAAVQKQVGKSHRAIVEIMEYLDTL